MFNNVVWIHIYLNPFRPSFFLIFFFFFVVSFLSLFHSSGRFRHSPPSLFPYKRIIKFLLFFFFHFSFSFLELLLNVTSYSVEDGYTLHSWRWWFFTDFWQHLGQRIMARTTNKPRRMYPCGKCQKIYSNASSLYRHLKLECGMLPQFHCPYCRFSSKRKFNLDSHVAHKHSKLLNCYVNKIG